MSYHRCLLLALALFLNLLVGSHSFAQIAPLTFPDVEGWVKGTRYDQEPPRGNVPRSTINYTTKDKVGKDYIRADVQIDLIDGKEVKDLVTVQEKKIMENPIMKNMKKTGATEVKVGEIKVQKVSFTGSQGSNDPRAIELYVIPYDKWYIHLSHSGPVADEKQRTAEAMKLVEALVGAIK
jgi:hypothetical protein